MEEHPPWFSKPENTHSGRILALAHCVFHMHYQTENHRIKGPVKIFDNKCAGDLEKVAHVLNFSGFTRFIDDINRRSVFICDPSDFELQSRSESACNVEPELVSEAIKWLAEGNFRSSDEVEYLAQNLR
ncbi:hypothetical protein [uncultured Ruegeria sp.]|uniref:hypothetical protein n=1 Tax=uncultured Ruegeria sp. TaxID=259304 RepID=UPI002623A113|nr:hypothetical protein [uncultured Ruegeria sp.]